MLYADILKSAEKHMTKKYDSAFAAAKKKGLRWYPWVGKSFTETKILVVGMATDDRHDGWRETAENDPNTSRGLVAWMDKDDDVPFDFKRTPGADGDHSKSFKQFSRMFAGGSGRDDTLTSRAALWELIAFNNFIQRAVPKKTQAHEYDPDDVKQAMDALFATINIIKPSLILVWSVGVVKRMNIGAYADTSKGLLGGKSGAYPRVFNGNSEFPPTVGVQHPWLWATDENQKQWFDFLENDPASKDPIGTLLERLRNHPTK